jgi:pyridoxal 5-phosphate dependent beta-lyase
MPFIPNEKWRLFGTHRPPSTFTHLDTAAAGRSSVETLRAVAAHAEREAVAGAYVAAAEAAPVIAAGRAALAGLFAVEPGGIAFTESGSAALAGLLRSWPLSAGQTVAVVPSEWGPNLDAFTGRGLRVDWLAVGPDGIIDLDALRRFVAVTPPAFVNLTLVASHRPLVQPAAEAASICHEAGVPLWVDAAQALGHVAVACGADAIYAVSRKWLTGPRGIGIVAVAEPWWHRLRPHASQLDRDALGGGSPVRLLESFEAHVAGRIGLCNAVAEFVSAGPAAVYERLALVGKETRAALAGLPGWQVVGETSAPSAITALRPLAGQNVPIVRSMLVEQHQIVTTAALPARAPQEMKGPHLRISPHVDCTPEQIAALAAALSPDARHGD